MVVAQSERRLTIVGCERNTVSSFEDSAGRVVPRDLSGRGQITLGDGNDGSQR